MLDFLSECADEHFLDFIEWIFQVEPYFRACPDDDAMVEEINHFLLLEDLPYAVTPFIRETRMGQLFGREHVSWLKLNLVWLLWAALLLPWVGGTLVPLSPRTGEAA